jgi:glucosamine--fructose-6-phosphate aminotransferase (isomerizing)
VPLHAWPETAVAATKSVIAEFVGGAFLAAELAGPGTLRQAFAELPSQLRAAMQGDNSSVAQSLAGAANLFVIGRGLGLSVAQEIALKFKETCGIHAEALSSAELRHGPMALLDEQSHALVLTLAGPGETELLDCAGFLRTQGVTVQTVGHQASASLTLPPTSGYVLNPVCALAALYPVVDEVALLRHRNPDAPLRIQKVTLTL